MLTRLNHLPRRANTVTRQAVRKQRNRLLGLAATLLVSSLAVADSAPVQTATAFEYGGQRYQQQSLPAGVRASLHQLEQEFNQQRRQVIDSYVINRYVREQAEQQNKSFSQLQQELLSAPTPSDADVEAFYNANKAQIRQPLAQVRDQLRNYLKQNLMLQRQQQLLARIGSEKDYRVELPQLPELRLPIVLEGYPSKGDPAAKVTLVEFADYQCPHCKQAGKLTKQLLADYGDQLRLVFRDFPINPSGVSRKVAEAAVCADRQGQYWPFHELAFERQSYLKSISVEMLADEAGLDRDAFDRCLASGEPQQQVARSAAEARELGVKSTPSFFVNGRPLPHSHGDTLAELKALIDQELAR